MSTLVLPPEKKLILPPDPSWAPLYYTKPKRVENRMEDVADFTSTVMTAERGMRKNESLHLTDWQKWAASLILEEKEDGFLRHRQFLLGLPRKNGKSMLGSAIALERLLWGTAGSGIFSAAKDREQAKVVFNYAKRQVKGSPVLSRVFKCYRDVIENVKTQATYRAISSDAMSAQGLSIELAIADEIHGWTATQAEEFWAALTEASGDLDESMVLAITTAGKNLESLLGGLYEAGIINAELDESPDDSLGFIWWGAAEDADIYDEDVWKQANPNLAEGLYKWEEIRGKFDLATKSKSGNINAFKRYRLNQWVRSDSNQMYITPFHWKQIEKPEAVIGKGRKICIGFDGSLSDDSTGFVAVDLETGLMEVLASWHRDYTNDEWVVPRDEVLAEQKRIFAEYDVVKMYCDDSFFQTDVMGWAKVHRGRVERIPQSNTRLVPMTEQMKLDIIAQEVSHNGDKKLREHFMNACLSDNGRIYKEARGSKNKIDLAMCAILANAARNRILRRGKAPGRAIVLS
jgi:phage terminase large subunit-like protein